MSPTVKFRAVAHEWAGSTTLGPIVRHLETPMSSSPPEGLKRYRLLTGKDDAAFCERVSEALALGFQLYGSPAATFNGKDVIVAQAVLWPDGG
jgi:hypothetical protein